MPRRNFNACGNKSGWRGPKRARKHRKRRDRKPAPLSNLVFHNAHRG